MYWLFAASACAPMTQGRFEKLDISLQPHFDVENAFFYANDGAPLGLSVWGLDKNPKPETVIVGVHGMNDYAGAFRWSAPFWAEEGVVTYAYDQRGFGRSPNFGVWPEEELMRDDLRTAVRIARDRHPDAEIAVLGVSMGAAVAMTAFASGEPPEADVLILSGPGFRGWGALPLVYQASLWTSAHVRPDWVVRPPKGIKVTPTDNREVLQVHWEDPYFQKTNRIDSVHGVVTVMERAHEVARRLPSHIPTLALYGGRDQIVPLAGVKRTTKRLPGHVKTAYYPNGYHMLLRDLGRQALLEDVLSFARDPSAELPSNPPEWPWRGQ